MNPHNVVADSDESAVVGSETNANHAGSFSPGSPSLCRAQAIPRQDKSDEPDNWLTIEHVASDPGQARRPRSTR
jgi:hypothetical protein